MVPLLLTRALCFPVSSPAVARTLAFSGDPIVRAGRAVLVGRPVTIPRFHTAANIFLYCQLRSYGRDRGKDVTRTISRLVDEMLDDLVLLDSIVCDTS